MKKVLRIFPKSIEFFTVLLDNIIVVFWKKEGKNFV